MHWSNILKMGYENFLSESNRAQSHNHLVRKQTRSDVAKLLSFPRETG